MGNGLHLFEARKVSFEFRMHEIYGLRIDLKTN